MRNILILMMLTVALCGCGEVARETGGSGGGGGSSPVPAPVPQLAWYDNGSRIRFTNTENVRISEITYRGPTFAALYYEKVSVYINTATLNNTFAIDMNGHRKDVTMNGTCDVTFNFYVKSGADDYTNPWVDLYMNQTTNQVQKVTGNVVTLYLNGSQIKQYDMGQFYINE